MYKIEIKKCLKKFHTFIMLRIEKYKSYTYSNTDSYPKNSLHIDFEAIRDKTLLQRKFFTPRPSQSHPDFS